LTFPQVIFAIQFFQQILTVFRNQVDHLKLECVGSRGGNTLADDAFGPLDIASALFRQTPGVGDGIVDHLAHHDFVLAGTRADADRMSSTEIGPRCHGGKIGGQGDQRSGRCRPRPGWTDIDDDRDFRGKDRLDDRTHGRIEAPGGIEFKHERPGGQKVRRGQFGSDEVGLHRADHIGNPYQANHLNRVFGPRRPRMRQQQRNQQQYAKLLDSHINRLSKIDELSNGHDSEPLR